MQKGEILEIGPDIHIRAGEIMMEFVQSSGPGGQNVNKTATAVQLHFNVVESESLPEAVKLRLLKLAGRRITSDGQLLIEARRFRTQEANRADALQRLASLIQRASQEPRKRKPTAPSRSSVEERLKLKKRRSEIKKSRRTESET